MSVSDNVNSVDDINLQHEIEKRTTRYQSIFVAQTTCAKYHNAWHVCAFGNHSSQLHECRLQIYNV